MRATRSSEEGCVYLPDNNRNGSSAFGPSLAAMLTRVTPIEFSRSTTSGRNKPALLVCQKPTGETVELIAKFSASCDEGAVNLAREVVAGCLAGDLGLPIPEPFLVEVSPECLVRLYRCFWRP